ncbi:MAG: putative recombination-associated protein [Prokaryotic dsDNA virus sp.]|nr:MAG: putative recombination-associated protein [Prokaryotic dsDNA virus sp.]|tara:strand:+ start:5487 stop:6419 length:933 start_codon:yes stop_codon:yes gene_type:complete
MFFKNIFVFAFTRPFTTTNEELIDALQEHTFTPCASTELRHFGWTNSLGKGSAITTESNGNILFCARSEEKILPAPYMKECIDEQIEDLESEQSRSVTKKEREQIKEDVIFNMLPRSFSRVVDTHAYINTKENIIVVNTSSRGKAEDVLALLRKTLGTLPVTSISPEKAPDEAMTEWLTYDGTHAKCLGNNFTVGMEAHFNSLGDHSASAVVRNQDLSSDEVRAHLDADQYVTKLALEFNDEMSFILCDDLSIKRIKFFDVLAEQNDDIDTDDVQAKLTADFTLMAGVLNQLIYALHSEFDVMATDYLEA